MSLFLIVGTVLVIFLTKTLLDTARSFKIKSKVLTPLIVTIALYVTGFVMRVSNNELLIDLGIFLTGMSTLFATLLFTLGIILGQIKYHNVSGYKRKK